MITTVRISPTLSVSKRKGEDLVGKIFGDKCGTKLKSNEAVYCSKFPLLAVPTNAKAENIQKDGRVHIELSRAGSK